MCAVNTLSLPAWRCPLMLEMSGSENIPHCPCMAVRLIESRHDPLSSGYAYDSVPLGRAVMECDSAPPFRVEPLRPYKRREVGGHFFLTSSTWLATTKAKLWRSFCSLASLTKAISLRGQPMRLC